MLKRRTSELRGVEGLTMARIPDACVGLARATRSMERFAAAQSIGGARHGKPVGSEFAAGQTRGWLACRDQTRWVRFPVLKVDGAAHEPVGRESGTWAGRDPWRRSVPAGRGRRTFETMRWPDVRQPHSKLRRQLRTRTGFSPVNGRGGRRASRRGLA